MKMMIPKLKTFLRLWISKLNSKLKNVNKVWSSDIARPFLKMNDPIKQLIHQMNGDANRLNKGIVSPTSTMNHVPLATSIYKQSPPPERNTVQPVQPQPPMPPAGATGPITESINSGVTATTTAIDEKTTKEFIAQLTSVEKKIDRFFNLIEKRVVKNAKEVIIRIKLNENSNSEQE